MNIRSTSPGEGLPAAPPVSVPRERVRSVLVPEDAVPQGSLRLKHGAAVMAGGYAVLVVVMLAIGGTLTHLGSSVGRWDESVNRWFVDHRTGTWNSITGTTTLFVNTGPAIAIAALITAVMATLRRWREATMIVMALTLELSVFLPVTFVVDRPRPAVPRLNSTPSTASFPSGHTAAATVLLVGLAIIVTCLTRNVWVRALTFLIAIVGASMVGFARVYRGMHHPTDVVAGAFLGASSLVIAVLTVRAATGRDLSERASSPPTSRWRSLA